MTQKGPSHSAADISELLVFKPTVEGRRERFEVTGDPTDFWDAVAQEARQGAIKSPWLLAGLHAVALHASAIRDEEDARRRADAALKALWAMPGAKSPSPKHRAAYRRRAVVFDAVREVVGSGQGLRRGDRQRIVELAAKRLGEKQRTIDADVSLVLKWMTLS